MALGWDFHTDALLSAPEKMSKNELPVPGWGEEEVPGPCVGFAAGLC